MKASKMINKLQKLIDKYGDFQVNMLIPIYKDENIVGEGLIPIRQIKYSKRLGKYFTDFTRGF